MNRIVPKDNDIAFWKHRFFLWKKDELKWKIELFYCWKTMTALVGESGSGKTIITNLPLRFMMHKGKYTGGTDIRDIPWWAFRSYISIVMQMFNCLQHDWRKHQGR